MNMNVINAALNVMEAVKERVENCTTDWQGYPIKNRGMCALVKIAKERLYPNEVVLREQIKGLISDITEDWPHYSGSYNYPVPNSRDDSSDSSTQFALARGAGTLWDRTTEYGQLRHDLMNFVLNTLEMRANTQEEPVQENTVKHADKALTNMIAVMQAFNAGKQIEVSYNDQHGWVDCKNPKWDWHQYTYRIKAMKPDTFDWTNVNPMWKYMARDQSGLLFFFEEEPIRQDGAWIATGSSTTFYVGDADIPNSIVFSSYVQGDVDWSESLLERPQGPVDTWSAQIKKGRMIEAIKAYREAHRDPVTGLSLGLRAAKIAVESIREDLRAAGFPCTYED